MMVKCPVCGERHVVNDNYDNNDIICSNSANRKSPKTFQNLVPEDILSSNQMMNRSSTKIDEKRPVTVIIDGPDYRPTAERIGQLKTNY